MKILLLDNYDSYTRILALLLGELAGEPVRVVRNDAISLAEIRAWGPERLVISPGPGHPSRPRDFGICGQLFDAFPDIPILGVCLGHQGLGLWAGAQVVHAPKAIHGQTSVIHHDGQGIFAGIPDGFVATRYHSLVVSAANLPPDLVISARSEDGLIMALRHRQRPFVGVQFHPESVGTPVGTKILANFIGAAAPRRPRTVMPKTTPPTPPPIPWRDPEAAFLAISPIERPFWLDAAHSGDRWSVIGFPSGVVKLGAEPWQAIRQALGPRIQPQPFPFGPGLYGYIGYGAARSLGFPLREYPSSIPDQYWLKVEDLLVFDHHDRQVYALGAAWARVAAFWPTLHDVLPPPPLPPLHARLNRTKEQYLEEVTKILGYLREGESYEACLSLEAQLDHIDPLLYHRHLRRFSPGAFGAYLPVPSGALVSASPELFLRISASGKLESVPIKGTRRRGQDAAEDERLAQDLLNSPKDAAELLMITDLWRSDLATVAQEGSVVVPEARQLRRHPRLMHTSSVIHARLRPELDAIDALQASFPGGSITGAPKHRTVALLDALEQRGRGIFTGAIGYLGRDGQATLSVAIRTAEFSATGMRIGAGGAIVIGSDPETEWEEVLLKLRAMLPTSATVDASHKS